ncbi:MAG: flavodoxin family protein [Candidatus Saccharibacteria bacterium]|nr:flavodoxin family protein [Candidatus Saccharibacteria bacterium]
MPGTQSTYDDLTAVFLNCTLKKSPETSHTELLMDASRGIMQKQGVTTELIRVADYDIAFGMQPDMTKHGWKVDQWPKIQKKIMAADIVVIGSPIWLGVKSSVATLVIERLYSNSGFTNDRGQYLYYGKTGGCIVTGNEDGVKAVAMETLYSLGHIGFVIPPQADAGWIGEAGPGPSFGDELEDGTRAGLNNDFTKRNTTFMTWNLLHTARWLKDNGGFPAQGNVGADWDEGERFGFEEPK